MQKYDVVVIGGGLIGCAAAYYLSQSGASVALIERGEINQGASGQNVGALHFQLEHRFIQQKNFLSKELEYCVALTQRAIEHWRTIETELDCTLELAMNGGLMVAETHAELELLQKKSAVESQQGLQVELLDKNQTQQLAPYLSNNVQGALFCPNEGHCNPRLLTPAYVQKAIDHGIHLLSQTKVTAIEQFRQKWHITIDHRTKSGSEKLQAYAVLNTGGAWSAEIATMANIHLPIFPVGLLINITEQSPPFMHHLIQHVGRKLSIKQVHDGNILIGGGWSARLTQQHGKWLSTQSPSLVLASVTNNLQTAYDIVPITGDLHLLRTWTETTGITADHLPIIGEVAQAPGFYVAAGGSSFTYGPTYARLISELILTDKSSFPIAPYSPNRFNPINMFRV